MKSELADQVSQYIATHYQEDINLSHLTTEFLVVPTCLNKNFKKKNNCTVMQYLEHIRMKNAQERLKETTLPISEIAQQVGYHDANYFTRAFKKVYGMTPREYRYTCAQN